MKKFVENIFATFFALLIVVGFFAGFLKYFVFTSPTTVPSENAIMGVEDDNKQQIILNPEKFDRPNNVIITSGQKKDNILLFDNENKDNLEGNTIPNSLVELKINSEVISTRSDPDGFFSIKMPGNLIQFTKGKVTTFDDEMVETNNYEFILVLRNFMKRTYFILENRKEVFSMSIGDLYSTKGRDYNTISSMYCSVEIDETVNKENFNISKDKNTLIIPSSVETLDFTLNKYIAFKIVNKLQIYSLEYCRNEWNSYGPSLQWHTATINRILGVNVAEEETSPISSPIEK